MNSLSFVDGSFDATTALSISYNFWLVGLSYLIAVLAAYAGLATSSRASNWSTPLRRYFWQAIGSVSLGGGVWAMHFLGMLALSLPVSVTYDPLLTGLSVIPAMAAAYILIRVVDRRELSASVIAAGGILVGSGIGTMHFIGMSAMKMQALISYDPLRFAISILVAVLLAAVAISVRRLPAIHGFPKIIRQMGSAIVVGLAVTGMHYTAMWATFFYSEAATTLNDTGVSNTALAFAVGIIAVLIFTLVISAAVFDQRLGFTKKALVKSEYHLRTILDHLPDGVITIGADASIQSFNSAAEKLFGYTVEQCLGQNVSMLMQPRDGAAHDEQVRMFLDGGKAKIIGVGRELTGCRSDSTTFPMFLKINKLEIQGQNYFVGIVRDISTQKAAEAELEAHRERLQGMLDERSQELQNTVSLLEEEITERRRAEEEAQRANRSKSAFLANMSHELRTPLNAILGFSEIISERSFGDAAIERYSDYASDILTSGEYLLNIINDILDLAKIEANEVELDDIRVDPVQLVENCLRLTKGKAESACLKLSTLYRHGEFEIVCDERKLQQILVNLLTNAIKFTETGGTISLSTCVADSGQFIFEVKDTGIGIAESDIPKILSPFGQIASSLSRKSVGTGLGLPLVNALVELHGGYMKISSVVGEGTRVQVFLPPSRIKSSVSKTALSR